MFKWFHEKMALKRKIQTFFRQIEYFSPEVQQKPSSIPCRVLFYHSFSRKNRQIDFLSAKCVYFCLETTADKTTCSEFSSSVITQPSTQSLKSNQKSEKLYTHNQIYFAFLYPKFQNFCHQNSNLTFTHQNCSNQSCTSS